MNQTRCLSYIWPRHSKCSLIKNRWDRELISSTSPSTTMNLKIWCFLAGGAKMIVRIAIVIVQLWKNSLAIGFKVKISIDGWDHSLWISQTIRSKKCIVLIMTLIILKLITSFLILQVETLKACTEFKEILIHRSMSASVNYLEIIWVTSGKCGGRMPMIKCTSQPKVMRKPG